MRALIFEARHEVWPLASAFTISRGSKLAADVVVVTVRDGATQGRGEAVPYARYGETVAGVLADIEDAAHAIKSRADLSMLKPGASRNALDCALWDLEAKAAGRSVADLIGMTPPAPVLTAYTLSLDSPEAMARKALSVSHLPLLKLKLGGAGDDARMQAVRDARPDARLIVDANEAWTLELFPHLMSVASDTGIEVIEQPLPEADDGFLRNGSWLVAICADESVHTARDLPRLIGRYQAINIKLDKAGGLTGALELKAEAQRHGLKIMIGSMVATSLAVAPAMLLAADADWTDLDGPLLLARDREAGLTIEHGWMQPATPELWG